MRDRGRPPVPDPVSLGDLVQSLLTRHGLSSGATLGRLARMWPDVVGERLAGETSPARLDAGVLLVEATSGAWGAQAQFLAEEIRTSANRALGSDVIKRVRVAVDARPRGRPKAL